MTLDYRLPENRASYFDALYKLNMRQHIMPGLVYLYMPALKHHYGWNAEQALWFAFINGMTQNPLTSLRIFDKQPEPVYTADFEPWFFENWDKLQYDTDRRYQKKDTPAAINQYAFLMKNGQEKMLSGRPFKDLWKMVTKGYISFGRLSSWSYLEYVKIMGYGADAEHLMFDDVSGSRSHRNGMLLLLGQDNLVYDKRLPNGFTGKYEDFKGLCRELETEADKIVDSDEAFSRFSLESNLCTFKNHFFGRRYPGVYADMAYERLKKYELMFEKDKYSNLLWSIRESLPNWLRLERQHDGKTEKERAAIFPETGYPYRGEYFL